MLQLLQDRIYVNRLFIGTLIGLGKSFKSFYFNVNREKLDGGNRGNFFFYLCLLSQARKLKIILKHWRISTKFLLSL